MRDKINQLRTKRQQITEGGGAKAVAKQHAAGKLTARERLAYFVDPGTFQETHRFVRHRAVHFGMADKEFPGEGVVTGHALVGRRPVYLASQDFTVAGGSLGEAGAFKIAEIMDMALKTGAPFVFINDGAGARIQEGIQSLAGYGRIFYRNVLLSGVVPQISIIAGPCAGGAAYSPALTDFIIQVRKAGQMYITGPSVIKEVTGEEVTPEQLGGVECHASYSGVVHLVAESGEEAMQLAARLLSFLPSNNTEMPPRYATPGQDVVVLDEALNDVVPVDPKVPYDMRQVIARIVDQADFFEIQANYAPNILIGFARVLGQTVGIVANQPCVRAGVLDIDASDKSSRFVRFCNAFNIPILTLVDVPGFLPGIRQEIGGIIRHGAKMLFAYAAATVPKITIIVRKAYGGAYLAMCGRDLGADKVAAWPTGEIAVMGAAGAVNILYREQIKNAADSAAERKERMAEYEDKFATPYEAAGAGLIDDVIEPAETRAYIATALEFLANKRELRPQKKHGLIPL